MDREAVDIRSLGSGEIEFIERALFLQHKQPLRFSRKKLKIRLLGKTLPDKFQIDGRPDRTREQK